MYYTGSNAFATLRQGLVGAWCPSLPNGGSGNTLPDQSGYNNHGSLVNMGPEDWVSSQYGRALRNSVAIGRGVTVQHRDYLSLTESLSGFCWLRVDTVTGVNYQTMFAKRVGAADPTACNYQLFLDTQTGRLGYFNLTIYVSNTAPTANTWNHAGFTLTNSGVLNLWLNGVSVYSTTGVTRTANNGDLIISARPTLDQEQLRGDIDDVRIYNRALSESEIRLLASRPGIGLRQDRDRNTFSQFPSGARRKRILTGMP